MRTDERLYTLREALAETGGTWRLVNRLIAEHQIPTRRIGKSLVFDEGGFAQLAEAVTQWRNRLRPYGRPRETDRRDGATPGARPTPG